MDTTTASAAPRPLRRDAELNRQRIMVAAKEVFAERGLEATLDEIARHAGLGVGTVYRRFPNKEALIDALFEEGFAQILALTRRALDDADAWAGLTGLLTAMAEVQATDFGLRDVMLSETYGRDRIAQMRDQIKPLLEQLVERAQAQGRLRADFRAADIMAVQLMVSATVEFTHGVRAEGWRRYLPLLLDGLCARRDAPTELTEPELDDDELHSAMRCWPRYRRGGAPGRDERA
ncbi:TetR/AcrR family transcriptional regulator [Actinocrinis puniceicyclus]|uniref:TetR/AcrR family transcriptional regulator n=1 Tax=Actinocrinis puniceicyclus TaxID=977794 RepID=A0A8J7WNG0_9ACTN|nr:TetR/AcrR family transcriptional regulator [Actinocrinis puniceicyclus]MBS2962927.1 TetR/AcrR family transcriptional regulator [Actinocrinis puniceicyclus]